MKKSLIFGLGALMLSALFGLGSLISAQASEYKESKADLDIANGLYLPKYSVTDEYLGVSQTENYLGGTFTLSLDNGVTTYTCQSISYNTRYDTYALYCEDNQDNIRKLLDNGVWQSNQILLNIVNVSSSGGDIGFLDYYFSNGAKGLSFTFNEAFNYNAFAQGGNHTLINLQVREKSPFLSFGSPDTAITTIEFNIGYFKTGGLTYDTIIARFDIATTDLIFDWQGGQSKSKLIDNANPYKFFTSLTYKNSATSEALQVATRNKYLNADSNTIINENVSWLSYEYRTITFYQDIDKQGYNYQVLSMANNNLIANGFNNANDIGLSGAFGVLGLAFTSLTGLLSIAIFPGITLGFLLFLPLITGIIIAVIWIVKR